MSLVAWIVTAVMGLLAVSQAFGRTWHPTLYVLQAFTVHSGVAALGLAVAAAVLDHPFLAIVNTLITTAVAVLITPVVRSGRQTTGSALPDDNASLAVLHVNTYYANRRLEQAADVIAAAASANDVDVIVITEYSTAQEAALRSRLGERYPHLAGASTDGRNGLGLLSRHPLHDVRFGPYRFMPGLEVTVQGVRVIAVHPVPGVSRSDLHRWKDDLEHIGDRALAEDEPPTLVVGDFNAARWHPPFRQLMDRGLTDVHEVRRRGFSTSWPVDWWRPRFVRLDHALVDVRLEPLAVVDLVVPGSDHTGFVVRVRR